MPALPADCTVVQIAEFQIDSSPTFDRGKVYRDPRLWKMLSPADQAALVLHGVIYFTAKDQGAGNSDPVRKLIALVFAGQAPEPLFQPVWNARRYADCFANEGHFPYADPFGDFRFKVIDEIHGGQAGLGLYFETFLKRRVIGQTSAFVRGVMLDELVKGSHAGFPTQVKDRLFGDVWNLDVPPASAGGYPLQVRASKEGDPMSSWAKGSCNAPTTISPL